MSLENRWYRLVASQLAHPRGVLGKVTANRLNEGNRPMVASAIEAAGLGPGQVAADVGFGGGVGLPLLLSAVGPTGRVHGYEISRSMIASARRAYATDVSAGRLLVEQGELADLPVPDGTFDAVITANTVYFVDDLGQAFVELHRVLRSGGRLVVAIADPAAMEAMPFVEHGFRVRPVAELLRLMQAAGFVSAQDRQLQLGGPLRQLLIASRPD
ncbi:SAM-dependent methyltransferase [Enemella dayhoffiae]|uniref:SAM-dependent methyltransferase n=1 Tax=Enemella dayhoffiae TaxID=2016507 RepID=A0A255H8T3_9ACTN|nr:methyltransferase domain-containing protein [Enemella dayhoffiae]OYO24148.1 SAM-dependent methyltransferase [Enemella dayhoffiae]